MVRKKIFIGMKETPTFKSINIGSSSFGNPQKDLGTNLATYVKTDNGKKKNLYWNERNTNIQEY